MFHCRTWPSFYSISRSTESSTIPSAVVCSLFHHTRFHWHRHAGMNLFYKFFILKKIWKQLTHFLILFMRINWKCSEWHIHQRKLEWYFYFPTKAEGYGFGIILALVCPSRSPFSPHFLSVWNHFLAPICQIWCNFGITDKFHGFSISYHRQNRPINTWALVLVLI